MNAHQVPAQQLLAALQRMEGIMADYKNLDSTSKTERSAHASQITELGTQIDRLTGIVDSYQQISDAHADTIGGLLDEHSAQMNKMDSAIAIVKSMKPLKGDPGDSPTIDVDSMISQVTDALRSEMPQQIESAPVDTDALYKEFVARLQKEMPIDVSHIRNGQSFLYKLKSGKSIEFKTEELMNGHGASGTSGSGLNFVARSSGTIDNTNKSFTFAAPITIVGVNGASYINGGGVTITGSAAVLDNPVGAGGSIYGLG